jgi:hypothetical protein
MKLTFRFDVFLAALLAICVFSINGCGDKLPERVAVSGHVFFDEKPLESGTLIFSAPGQRQATAVLGPGGKFTVTTFTESDGLMLGKHQVAVIAREDVNANTIKWLVPKKYAEVENSGLEVDITGSDKDIKIKLTSEPGKKYPLIEKF